MLKTKYPEIKRLSMKLGFTAAGSGATWFMSWILWDALKLWNRTQLSLFINVVYLLVALCWIPLFASELRKPPKVSKARRRKKIMKTSTTPPSSKSPFTRIAEKIAEKKENVE